MTDRSMRPSQSILPLALLIAAPAFAEVREQAPAADEAAITRNADGSFTIAATIEPIPEALDALPWEKDQTDGKGDASRRPREEADEALDEAFEEAEDIARMETGPD
jgi:hypothetical protein